MFKQFVMCTLLIVIHNNAWAMDNESMDSTNKKMVAQIYNRRKSNTVTNKLQLVAKEKTQTIAANTEDSSSFSSSAPISLHQSSTENSTAKRNFDEFSLNQINQTLNIKEQIKTEITSSSSSSSQPKKKSSWDYNPIKTRNLYDPSKPFKLSRSKLENNIQCPTCSYFDLKLGLTPPPGYPFNLNSAVDELQKKDFDTYREKQEQHPLCIENNVDAIPFQHPDIEKWQNALSQGIKSKEIPGTNIFLQGGIDDIWQNQKTRKLHVVDYKATSKKGDVSLDADWQDGYKRQVEVYQYCLRDMGFDVSDTAYFPYSNANKEAEGFNNKLEFKTSLLSYQGNTAWIQPAVVNLYQRLQANKIPTDTQTKELAAQCAMCQCFKRRNELIAQDTTK